MKRLTAALLAACTAAASMMFPVSADTPKLPFALTAPESVFVRYHGLTIPEYLNSCYVYCLPNRQWAEWHQRLLSDYSETYAELESFGYSDLSLTAQIDWSIDSQDDWHYNAFWDTGGYDGDGTERLGGWAYNYSVTDISDRTVFEIFSCMGDIGNPKDSLWNGDHGTYENFLDPAFWDYDHRGCFGGASDTTEPVTTVTTEQAVTYTVDYDGWKDVLKPEQYEETELDGQRCAKIDFTAHTAYVRMRWLVTAVPRGDGKEIRIASDWSEIAAVGKNAPPEETLKPGEIAAPAISECRYTGLTEDSYPQITYRISVDQTLAKQMNLAYSTDCEICLDAEYRLQDTTEWVSCRGLAGFGFPQVDWEITESLRALAESTGIELKNDTPIEFRVRYRLAKMREGGGVYTDSDVLEAYDSGYSETVHFGDPEKAVTQTSASAADPEPAAENGAGRRISPLTVVLLLAAVISVITACVFITKKNRKHEG